MVYRHLGGWSGDVGLKEEGRGSMVAMVRIVMGAMSAATVWVASAILSTPWASPRPWVGYFFDFGGKSSAMSSCLLASPRLLLFGRLRWQAIGYVFVLVGESSATSLGMSGDLGKSV